MSVADYSKGDKALWQAGREYERERIIALLLDNTCPTCEAGDLIHQGCEANLMCIALIKGENDAERRQPQMSANGDKGENK